MLSQFFLATLEPEWQLDLGSSLQQISANEEWVLQGRVTADKDKEADEGPPRKSGASEVTSLGSTALADFDPKDPCPWLRTVQREGLELVIIGSTIEAVRTCNNAYQAGFMSVLILLSDLAVNTEEVEEELLQLASHCWIRRPFKVGPCLISSSRDRCVVNFDCNGNPVDVYVRTNIFGMTSNAEAWQYFKGPVLIIDPPALGDEFGRADANGHRTSLSVAMEQEAEERSGWRHREVLQESLRAKAEDDQEREAQASARSARSSSATASEEMDLLTQTNNADYALRLKAAQARKKAATKRMLLNEATKEAAVITATLTRGESQDPADGQIAQRRREEAAQKYYQERLPLVRDAFVDCNFWKERYDPDRLGYTMASYRKMFLCATYYFFAVLILAMEGLAGVLHSGWFVSVRVVMNALFVAPVCVYLAVALSGSLGFIARLKPNRMNMKVGITTALVVICFLSVSIDSYHLSFPVCSVGGLATTWVVGVLTARYWEKRQISYWNLKWSFVLSVIVFLSLLFPLIVVACYLVALVHVDSVLPSLLLMPAFLVTELVLTTSVCNSYEYLVWDARQRQTNCALGDQRSSLSIVLMVILGALEAGRTTAVLAGALCKVNTSYFKDAMVAIVVGLIQNVLHRSGWFPCLMATAVPHHMYWCCPTSAFAFCQDTKLILWWAPFFFPIALALARGVISWNWSIPRLESTDHTVWCWNQILCMVFCISLVAKVTEDVAVTFFHAHCRAPMWEVFGAHMHAQMTGTSSVSDPCHNFHLLLLDRKEADLSAAAMASRAARPTIKAWAMRSSIHLEPAEVDESVETRLISAPTLRHSQEARLTQMLIVVCAQYLVFYCTMTIAVGPGNMHTRCPVLGLDGLETVLLRLVLLTTDPARECDPFAFLGGEA